MLRNRLLTLLIMGFVLLLISACGAAAEPQTVVETVVVEKEVIKEVEVEKIVTVEVEAEAPPLLERAREDGLRVGFVQEAPFGFINDEGVCTGFDIEVTREAAKRLGIEEIVCVHLAWEGLIPGLIAGRIDIIPVGMAIKPERCEVITFTHPYQAQGIAALVEKGNPEDIQSFQDFVDRDDIKLGGSVGATELQIAREQFGVPEDRAIGYSEQVQAIDDLKAGRIDAVMYTATFINRYLKDEGTDILERAIPFESPSYFNSGHAFRQDDAEFVELWNDTLREMKEDGTMAELGADWGFTEADLIGPEASSAACCATGDDWQQFACGVGG